MASETAPSWLHFPGFVAKNQRQDRQRRVHRATAPLAAGAIGTTVGVVVCISGGQDIGGGLSLAGGALLLWGLHRVGRLGADPPASLDG